MVGPGVLDCGAVEGFGITPDGWIGLGIKPPSSSGCTVGSDDNVNGFTLTLTLKLGVNVVGSSPTGTEALEVGTSVRVLG